MQRLVFLLLAVLFSFTSRGRADDATPVVPLGAVLPPGDDSPILRLETGGPRSFVSALAFSKDGKQLYSAGWDKAVQVWNLNDRGRFEPSPTEALRVPTGGGLYGGLNALAISEDGEWLATAGQGPMRGRSGERDAGWVLPTGVLGQEEQHDEGLIYVFNILTRKATLLRGHRGPVQALTFVRGSRSSPPELVSVAQERMDGYFDLHPQVRFWDVAHVAESATLSKVPAMNGTTWVALPDLQGFRPGLTAWSTGPGGKQARVAIAWGDDQFRIWDVQTGAVANAKSNPRTLAVVPLSPSGERLFTGAQAEAGVWTVPMPANRPMPALNRMQFQLASIDAVNNRPLNLPTAMALIPGAVGNPSRLAMVVTRYLAGGQVSFHLIIASSTAPYSTVREIDLKWQAEIRQPSLAVSADGKRLAVSGNQLNEIAVFEVEDLLKPADPAPQILRSSGTLVRDATFVRNEAGNWGLQLTRSDRDPGAQDGPKSLVLDIRQRRIATAANGWEKATADVGEWTLTPRGPGLLQLQHPGQQPVEIRLDDRYALTTYAICPKSAHCSVPLVAVAAQERGQPSLQIYRADTGVPLRWCVGHTGPVQAVHFASDGRMLLSVGADRTISVWTVTDLDKRTIGKHGRIAGLVVQSRDKRLVVLEAPGHLPLQKGDEIESVSIAGEMQSLESASEFYQLLLRRIPGEKVQLTILRNGGRRTVDCPIDQAIDESKPLFTVLVAPSGGNAEWEWIGWHPLGAFSTRSEVLHGWLGWHFNTGEPEQPVSFAPVGEYRDRFYDRDLLQKLIDKQELPPPERTVETPRISAWFRYRDQTPARLDYDDRAQINSSNVDIVADIAGISLHRVIMLEAVVNDAAPVEMQHVENQEWTASLSQYPWKRGKHHVTVRLKTPDREVTQDVSLDFRPSLPLIDWEPAWKREIQTENVNVRAKVTPSTEPVRFRLVRQRPADEQEIVVKEWPSSSEVVEIDEVVSVEPGENRLAIVAWNDTAPEGERHLETLRIPTVVRRSRPAQAPNVVVNAVLSHAGLQIATIVADDDDIYVTHSGAVQIRGEITASADLDLASFQIGDHKQDVANFKPAATSKVAIDELLTLKPGMQSLIIRASVGDALAEKRLVIKFLPPLPRIKSLSVSSVLKRPLPAHIRRNDLARYESFHDQTVDVTAILEGNLDQAHRFQLISQTGSNEPLTIAAQTSDGPEGQRIITGRVALVGGKNVIKLHLQDPWNQQVSEKIEVDYLRPPEIIAVAAEKVIDKPLDLMCRIRSPIPVRSALVLIDGLREERQNLVAQVAQGSDEWSFELKNIGLAEGEHDLAITATNDEGTTLEPTVHKVVVQRRLEKTPELIIVSPGKDGPTADRRLKIEYRVESKLPARIRIEIQRAGEIPETITIPEDKVRIDGHVGAPAVVDLFEGINTITVTAQNSAGESLPQKLMMSLTPPPARVEVLAVDDLQPQLRKSDGKLYFNKPVAGPRALLKCRVVAKKKDGVGGLRARVCVNGIAMLSEQITIADMKTPHIGTFESQLVLGQIANNAIEVEVFRSTGERVARELGHKIQLQVDCSAPESKLELYVLLLGKGEKQSLLDRVRSSLLEKALIGKKSRNESEIEQWTSAVFDKIFVYEAVDESDLVVQGQLLKLSRKMQGAQKRGGQPILMFYYQGQITLADEDFAFGKMDPNLVDQNKMVTGRFLHRNLINKCGAHVVFLDLQQDTENLTASEVWPKSPNLGIAVANWAGRSDPPDGARLVTLLERTLPGIRRIGELFPKFEAAIAQFRGQIEMVDRLNDIRNLRIGELD